MSLTEQAKRAARLALRRAARLHRVRRLFDLCAQELYEIAQVETASVETRTFYEMRRPVQVVGEDRAGHCRTFRRGLDESRITEVLSDAFAWDIPTNWDRTLLSGYLTAHWFDPRGLVVYEDAGEVLGTALIKLGRNESGTFGEFLFIAVAPKAERRGIGRQLIEAGLRYLASHAVPKAVLYVDAANLPAIRLYLSLGFAVHRVERRYGEPPVLSLPSLNYGSER